MLVNATPIHPSDGAVESVVVTVQDLAPLRELERQRAEFLDMVSHELRAPLSAIKGSAATLVEVLLQPGPRGDARVQPHHRRAGRAYDALVAGDHHDLATLIDAE